VAFLRLIRIQNLMLIALTMVGVGYAIVPNGIDLQTSINFNLFIICTLLIAAAGNTINDYFDVRADLKNKPDQVVIGKKLKKRWAIILHWGFNALAFGISIFLSMYYQTWFYMALHLFTSGLLWLYSVKLKKVFLWSNLSIAALTALVPLSSMMFFRFVPIEFAHTELVVLFTIFAFILNLIREIVKDIQDVEGDKLLFVRSLPIVLGKKVTMRWVQILSFMLLIPYLLGMYLKVLADNYLLVYITSTAVLVGICAGLIASLRIQLSSLLLKISMLIGISSFFFL